MLIEFKNLNNVRDIGGIVNKEGKKIKEGFFIRSGYLLELDPEDAKKISELASLIVDLRTNQETEEKPDDIIPRTQYLHLPIFNEFKAGVTREEENNERTMMDIVIDPKASKAHMVNTYKYFVENDYARSQYARLIRLCIDENDRAVLYHCTAGKDRTGIATVILLEILGVDRETIIKDYMSTNDYLTDDYTRLTGDIKAIVDVAGGGNVDLDAVEESLWYFFGAQMDFINTYYEIVEENYGTFENFIEKGLGITKEECEVLRKKALV